MAHKLSD